MARIYLDYAASTPVDPRVFRAMTPYFSEKFGNAGSLHSFGQEAIAAVDRSRETIATSIRADFREVIFTGSATEANNLALRGTLKAFGFWFFPPEADPPVAEGFSCGGLKANSYKLKPRIIVSAIEHDSVLETARDLERYGVEVIYLPVDKNGLIDLRKLGASLNNRTVLVSVTYANNEIGTIQPIAEIANIIRNFRNSKHEARNPKQIPSTNDQNTKHLGFRNYGLDIVSNLGFRNSDLGAAFPLFHTDAVQAFQFLDCNVHTLGVDFMTLSAHKIYGPKGIGALYRSIKHQASGVRESNMTHDACGLTPIITGGGQEFGFRSGTENIPLIVGFAKAVEVVAHLRELENKRISELRNLFWRELKKICSDAEINGGVISENPRRNPRTSSAFLPNILNVYFPGKKAEELLTKFDIAGLAVSSGSACRSRAMESSYVIEALGFTKERANKSIRFSFGRPTSQEDIDRALETIRMSIE